MSEFSITLCEQNQAQFKNRPITIYIRPRSPMSSIFSHGNNQHNKNFMLTLPKREENHRLDGEELEYRIERFQHLPRSPQEEEQTV